eukprot:CAMPEP_0118962630 /NCGR_PEP_ID=MMETSP1173-20130426/894_1 /TAXON_ID=1034831 /ORGANISM="Rhizochromulina marina cf, Strain CCMP1243" /LENGTH=161 /DNA_ID=CAMNT_0006910915 /DNA_START=79 /DNA_END=564 /DNA_ORIENTATION=-
MPKFVLKVKATLENIASMRVEPNNQWAVVVQNADASERCEAYFSRDEEMDLQESRGTAHFIKKWPMENKQSYLKIIDPKNLCKEEITAEDSEEWVALLAIECRGLEPVAWLPKPGDFTVTTTGGSVFQEVEFDDGIWAEYDAEADEPVSINELTSTFEVCR